MAIRQKLSDEDRDKLTKDVNDLDKVYLEKMKKDGMDPKWMEQFRDLSLEMDKHKNEK